MKNKFRVSGKSFDLSSDSSSDWKWSHRPGGWIIGERTLAGGKTERVRVAAHEARGKLTVSALGKSWFGEIQSVSAGGGASGSGSGSDADLIAQFPGKVRKVLVKIGESVIEGQPLVLVEAMKMEFAVKAPYAGRVSKLLVTEGQQLSPGVKLVDLEESKSGK